MTTAHQLLSNVYDKAPLPATPKISVLYAARSMDDLLLIPELAEYQKKYPGKVKLHIWTESEPSSLHGALYDHEGQPYDAQLRVLSHRKGWLPWHRRPSMYQLLVEGQSLPLYIGRPTQAQLQFWSPQKLGERMVLVCGPEGFVSAMAGPKGLDLWTQGPLQGVLAALGYHASEVFKL